ncbi:hypothetical protein PXK01_05885 [Phaeobacter sp. PT47_59]|uniref:hypothetical protein n=1 Tax=Phaeobacter sp. PT47_59 TaxID=3029979 RepID=UPI002380B24E|nr:hypothetical protein [Phaeobacter sp. PT47_59]MDE4173675.1 hypothetical protein [Phaeobacter sp. PT47_59]
MQTTTTQPTDTYIDDETYAALRAELLRLVAEQPVHPEVEIVRILGEVGGVWPRSVLDDAEREEKISDVA